MTATAQRIKETPMAPYMALLRGMTREQKQIVVTFITESMEEAEESETVPMTNAEIIREKYKNLRISPRAKALVEGLSLSEEEMEDERTKYILGL
jgi:hypothetical protein